MKVVLDKKRENLFQVACLRLFEGTHKNAVTDNVGNHPNGFFNSSVQYIKAVEQSNAKKQANGANNTPTTTSIVQEITERQTEDVEMQ